MKLIISMLMLSFTASAQAANFCDQYVIKAAKDLADTNGSISADAAAPVTNDGKNFAVKLTEDGAGPDTYVVVTDGGHDCIIRSVNLVGQPTLRN